MVNMDTISNVSVVLNRTKLILKSGESGILSATVFPENITNKSVIWYSDDTNIATVDNGRVLGLSEGVTTIHAASVVDSGMWAKCKVIVSNDILVSDIWINPSTMTMYPGNSTSFTASVIPIDATNRTVIWSSDDPSVASVDADIGMVSAHKPGITKIWATAMDYSGESACCEIVVDPIYLVDKYGDEVVTFSYEKDGDKSLSKNFKVREFRCKDGSDEILIDMELVRYLQQIRDWAGGSIKINSGYRTPSHNAKVGGSKTSKHLQGRAADIVCSKKNPLQLAQKAETLGMKGIEWNPVYNYTHVDTREKEWHVQYAKDEDNNPYFIYHDTFYGLS